MLHVIHLMLHNKRPHQMITQEEEEEEKDNEESSKLLMNKRGNATTTFCYPIRGHASKRRI